MTMRRCLIMLIGAAVIVAAGGTLGVTVAAEAKKPVGIKYQVSTGVEGDKEVALTKVWVEGAKIRVEERGQVIIKVGDTVTRWLEKENKAYRIKGVSEYYELSGLALPMYSRAFKQGAKKVGEETIGGRLCDIYSWRGLMPPPPPGETKPLVGPESKLWLSRDHKIPMKRVRTSPGPGDKTYVSTAKNIEVGIDIPDSMFQAPKGMKIVEMPAKPAPKGRPR